MTRPSLPTLEDVAAVAQVSAKTVSNVLRGKPGASPQTQARVRQAAADIGYHVSLAGTSLASGHTRRIAIVIPMLYQPYFAEMAELVLTALRRYNYFSTIRIAPQPEDELAAIMDTDDVDGVIVLPHADIDEVMADLAFPKPTVLLGGLPSNRCDSVVMGECSGMTALARHVVLTGHRRVAFIWNSTTWPIESDNRFVAATSTLRQYGLTVDPALIAYGSDWDRRMSGYEAMLSLLRGEASFDAAICINDALAVGALRALRLFNLSVPDDVVVTGFDDTLESKFTAPALTTVNPRKDEMTHHAVHMLMQRVEGYTGPARQITTKADLVVRASAP